jgi:16S rRNA (guanine527-N7)-methyltransferase
MAAAASLSAYGPADFQAETGVSRETLARLERYADLLASWNAAINLVGPATLPDLWRRHMLDSAQLLPLLPPARPVSGPGGRVLADLGSGAGFPGLVLAICGAGEVHLIESDLKKATFLRQAARETGTYVTVHATRIERVGGLKADVVTARALAPLARLVAYARPLLTPGGQCLFLKGRGVESELTDLPAAMQDAVERIPSRSDPSGCVVRLGEPLT